MSSLVKTSSAKAGVPTVDDVSAIVGPTATGGATTQAAPQTTSAPAQNTAPQQQPAQQSASAPQQQQAPQQSGGQAAAPTPGTAGSQPGFDITKTYDDVLAHMADSWKQQQGGLQARMNAFAVRSAANSGAQGFSPAGGNSQGAARQAFIQGDQLASDAEGQYNKDRTGVLMDMANKQYSTGERKDTQQFATGERQGAQQFASGERQGTQQFQAGESALSRTLQQDMQSGAFGHDIDMAGINQVNQKDLLAVKNGYDIDLTAIAQGNAKELLKLNQLGAKDLAKIQNSYGINLANLQIKANKALQDDQQAYGTQAQQRQIDATDVQGTKQRTHEVNMASMAAGGTPTYDDKGNITGYTTPSPETANKAADIQAGTRQGLAGDGAKITSSGGGWNVTMTNGKTASISDGDAHSAIDGVQGKLNRNLNDAEKNELMMYMVTVKNSTGKYPGTGELKKRIIDVFGGA